MLPKVMLSLLLLLVSSASAFAQEIRHFTFHYGFTVKAVSAGSPVRVWIPAAHSDPFQEVKVISASGDLPLKKTRESRFGNEIYFAQASKGDKPELHFAIVYEVVRHQRLTLGAAGPRLAEATLREKSASNILGPISLCPSPASPPIWR
jgi:hypothetical protein